MRSALIALLAFVAGIALMLAWSTRPAVPLDAPPRAPGHALIATSSSSPALAQPDDEDVDDVDRWPADAPTPEQVMVAQPQLLRAALARLSPRVASKPNLYLLAFAGDGAEDVFHNEAEYAAQLFTRRFGPTAHALVLENHPATLATAPLADWSNLESALDGLARVMRPEDILVLYLTSHGSEDHTLLVDMDPLPLDQIGAEDLGAILQKHPFRWKVIVVNACYSGGFVPSVRGAGTLVITAARSDRSSFGCGSDSDATYFGKAWLVDALNHTDNFADAFQQASGEVATWERQDKLTPSEPQIDIGSGIATQLALWRKSITPGPAVPFKPSTPATPLPASTATNN
jgi:hypothetical protein